MNPNIVSDEEKLIAFYSGIGTDHAGRRIQDVWNWSDKEYEEIHDYIQWLFPNREKSRFNPFAPLLTDSIAATLRNNSFLQSRILRSFERMCAFYRISKVPCEYYGVKEGPPYWWDSNSYSHNWLRMTRIILCVQELGLKANAAMFYEAINKAELPDSRTRSYWQSALES